MTSKIIVGVALKIGFWFNLIFVFVREKYDLCKLGIHKKEIFYFFFIIDKFGNNW
jgi:hypothetical protein